MTSFLFLFWIAIITFSVELVKWLGSYLYWNSISTYKYIAGLQKLHFTNSDSLGNTGNGKTRAKPSLILLFLLILLIPSFYEFSYVYLQSHFLRFLPISFNHNACNLTTLLDNDFWIWELWIDWKLSELCFKINISFVNFANCSWIFFIFEVAFIIIQLLDTW